MKIKLDNSYSFLIPYNVPMIRLGDRGDGGYVIAKKSLEASNLISLGLGTNWSFDKHWLQLNPSSIIHGYDGTIDPTEFSTDVKNEYDSFFKGNVKHFKENVTASNIQTILNRVVGSTFLKMDIEAHEYDVLPAICQATNIVGMAIEFHTLDFDHRRANFKSVIESLSDYKIVHVHANNYGGVCEDSLPHTLEISFLRNDLCDAVEKRFDFYLNNLDSPNALTNEDYMLYFVGDE